MTGDTLVWDDEDGEELEDGGGVFELEAGMAVWVMREKCKTCIFRPGNLMHLDEGRLKDLVETNVDMEGHIVCHDTLLYGHTARLRPAICRGYADHPDGKERSLALRTGRAMKTIHYQFPRKEPSVLLAELLATTGLSMHLKKGTVQKHSTGWVSRHWRVFYDWEDRTFATNFQYGNSSEPPSLLETLTHTLQIARAVCGEHGVRLYEEWARGHDENPAAWPSQSQYAEHVSHTVRLETFLGEMFSEFLAAADIDSAEHMAEAPASLDALAPGQALKRPVLEGVKWMVPDCTHQSHSGQLCTWRVLAVHLRRVVVAGHVVETERGYRGLAWDADGREVRYPERSFRERAVVDVCTAYDPARHDKR